MDKKIEDYKEIKDSLLGRSVEDIVKAFKDLEVKDKYYIAFNNSYIFSDDTMDEAYLRIVGTTKAEHDAYLQNQKESYEKELEEHTKNIPNLTKEWIEKGNEILEEKYQKDWAKIVPIRLGDLYRGMELEASLDLIKILNNGGKPEKAKKLFYSQGHSGMSGALVLSMVTHFCERGKELEEICK